MCGNNSGKGSLNLYITKSAYVDISKGIKLIDEFIERAQKMSNRSMRKSMTTMPMFKGKFSTRKLAATKFKEKVNKVKGHDGGWSVDRYKQEIKDENGNVVDTVPLIAENTKKRKREDGSRFKEGEIVKIGSTRDMAPTTKLYVEAAHTFLATCSSQWVKRSDVWKGIVKEEGMLKHSFEGRLSEAATQSKRVRLTENAGLYITKVGGEFKMMRVM
jgi:hypothetical protein